MHLLLFIKAPQLPDSADSSGLSGAAGGLPELRLNLAQFGFQPHDFAHV